MKSSGICPKCHSKKITKVKGRASSTHYLTFGRWLVRNEKLDTYVCAVCGFSERYAQLSNRFLLWARENIIEVDEEGKDFV